MAAKSTSEKAQELIVNPNTGMPAHLAGVASTGKGVSMDKADRIVPLVYLLDTKSKYVKASGPDYVQGAVPGDIYLRGVSLMKEILFQPCWYKRDFAEWVPRTAGGGIVGHHAIPADYDYRNPIPFKLADGRDVRPTPDSMNPKKIRLILPNGNELVETRTHAGFVILPTGAFPFVIPMAGTNNQVSVNWTGLMKTFTNERGLPMDSFSRYYKITSKERHQNGNDWFVYDVKDAGWVPTVQDYERGLALYNDFETGAKEAAAADDAAPDSDQGAM